MGGESYILAHDLGTTGNKASLFDDRGTCIASSFRAYETAYPQVNWAEQDADDWQHAVWDTTRELVEGGSILSQRIAAVSFSGMMNGMLPVDAAGLPLRSAIIWADQRATKEADDLARRCGAQQVYERTGHRPGASYTAAKTLWFKRRQPALYSRTHQVLQAKDYAAFAMCGRFATDFSDASGTNLFDLAQRTWAPDLMQEIGLDRNKFPDAFPAATRIGEVTPAAAAATGLLAGTPVVIGGGDGACATVGAGSVAPGDAYNYLGSSSWIAVTTDRPLLDPLMRTFTFAHLDPDLYFPTGTMQCAGGALDWLERLLRGESGDRLYADLEAAASAIEPGARGLLFLPYLLGERSPRWNPLARGVFAGLSMSHGRAEMARAVLEGVALNLKTILEAFLDQGADIRAMRLIGGGARSAVWRQILADVYAMPILCPALPAEATSLGAAIAGGVAVGLFADYRVAHELVRVEEAETPDDANVRRYAALHAIFERAYEALAPIYDELDRISE